MLTVQGSGFRLVTSSVFGPASYKPCFHDAVLSATEWEVLWENEGLIYGTKKYVPGIHGWLF